MTPVKVNHPFFQGKIIGLLYRHSHLGGEALAECAIKAKEGTKGCRCCLGFKRNSKKSFKQKLNVQLPLKFVLK